MLASDTLVPGFETGVRIRVEGEEGRFVILMGSRSLRGDSKVR